MTTKETIKCRIMVKYFTFLQAHTQKLCLKEEVRTKPIIHWENNKIRRLGKPMARVTGN